MNEFECVTPILRVRDFAASMEYYVTKLGFKKKWDWGDPPTFGCVARDKVEIFFCQGGQGRPGMWLSVFMPDVGALHEEYKMRGATILRPPTNMPWGIREMLVQDLDGHTFRMGSESSGPVDQVEVEHYWEVPH
jgi:predicted enzyme related to lactoylglutathione lyase